MTSKSSDRKLRILEASERSGEAAKIGAEAGGTAAAPDPEVPAKATRRRFTARYKLRILEQAESCGEGEIGALLRREGLYYSNLQAWRRQRDQGMLQGLSPKKRGRKPEPKNPLSGEVARLERENRRLKRKLERAEVMLEIQKKASELMGISLRGVEEDES